MSARRIRLSLETPGGEEDVLVTTSPEGVLMLQRGEKTSALEVATLPDGRLSLLLEDGRQLCGRVARDPRGRGVVVTTRAGAVAVRIEDALAHRLAAGAEADDGSGEEIHALMPGRVLEVSAREGEQVSSGAVLLIVEAMKMQNEIRSTRGGRILRVAVAPGQAVERGELMVSISAGA
ncbi:MAG: biotin/lipoyl-containing protein [Acidobacteriota bacterium]